jgi:hypothetical protein
MAHIQALHDELKSTREELASALGRAQAAAEDGVNRAKGAQATADAAKRSVDPLAQSEVLQRFIALVKWEDRGRGKYFWFPNVAAWDVRANGQFYSGHDFKRDSPFEGPY